MEVRGWKQRSGGLDSGWGHNNKMREAACDELCNPNSHLIPDLAALTTLLQSPNGHTTGWRAFALSRKKGWLEVEPEARLQAKLIFSRPLAPLLRGPYWIGGDIQPQTGVWWCKVTNRTKSLAAQCLLLLMACSRSC